MPEDQLKPDAPPVAAVKAVALTEPLAAKPIASVAVGPVPAGTVHDVSPSERTMIGQHMSAVAMGKAAIYDLQVQLEKVRATLAAAEGAFTGATSAITMAHGMTNASISPDLLKITAAR